MTLKSLITGLFSKLLFLPSIFLVGCLFFNSPVKSQIQAGLDASHPTVILMNTDSNYVQYQHQGWFKFNSGNFASSSTSAVNLKTVLLPTSSRIIAYDTVYVNIINLYDSTLNLIATDTIKHYWDTINLQINLIKQANYYIQVLANYPCENCIYNSDPIGYILKLVGNEQILCVPDYCKMWAYFFDPTTPFYYPYLICTSPSYACNSYSCHQPVLLPDYTGDCVGNQGGVGITQCTLGYTNYPCVFTLPSTTVYPISNPPTDFDTTNISCQWSFINVNGDYQISHCEDANTLIPIPYATTTEPLNTFTICPGTPIYLYFFDNCHGIHCPSDYTYVPTYPTYGTFQVISNIGTFNYPANTTPFLLNLPQGVTDFTIHYNNCCYNYGWDCATLYGHIIPSPTVDVTLTQTSVCLGSNNVCFYYDNISSNYTYTTTVSGPNYYQSFTGLYTSSNPMCLNNIITPGVYTLTTFVTFNYNSITPGTSYYCKDTFVVNKTFTISINCTNPNPMVSSFGKQNINLINCSFVANGTPGAIPFSSLSSNGNYSNILIAIPPSGTIDGVFTIEGNLTISTPLTITNSDIAFREGASIIQNAPLTIKNSYLHACKNGCMGMWKGIQSNHKITILHSFIEDAQNAFKTNINNHPGIFVSDVVFNKNYASINIFGTISYAPNNFVVTNSIFTSRQIPPPTITQLVSTVLWRNMPNYSVSSLTATPTDLLLGSTILGIPNNIRSQLGIVLQLAKFSNNTSITIGQWTNNHSQQNIFDNIGNIGISGISSMFKVYDNYFTNFTTGPDPVTSLHKAIVSLNSNIAVGYAGSTNFSAITNTFVSCITGVFATSNSTLSVVNNQFVFNTNAIEIEKLQQTSNNINSILKNNFNTCTYDVKSTNNSSIKLLIDNNTSTFNVSGLVKLLPSYNVYAVEPSINASVQYTINGNNFKGKRTSGIFLQNITGSYISSNLIEMVPSIGGTNYVSNIALENTQQISVTDNTLTCNPTATSNWNNFGILNSIGINNEFCGNIINKVGICMKHQGNSPSIITNNVLNNNTSDKALIGIWLAFNGFIGDIEYNSGAIQHAPAGNIFGNKKLPSSIQYDFQIGDTYSTNSSIGSNIYVFPFPLYNNLYVPLNNSSVPGNIPFTNINSSYPNQIATCQNLPTNNFKLSPGIPQFVQNPAAIYFNPHLRRVAEKRTFEFLKKENINVSPIPNGINFINNEITSNHGKFLSIDSLAEMFVTTMNSNLITQAENINSTITPTIISEVLQKNFNEIYLKFLKNDSLITSVDIDTLRSIAGKCPFTEGTAVYQARALLSKYDTLIYFNGCEVSLPPVSSARSGFLLDDENNYNVPIMVYPNPAKDFVAVWAPEGSTFDIYDISGKLLLSSELNNTTSKVIDIKNLSDGLYLYKIIKNNVVIKSDKLVLMR